MRSPSIQELMVAAFSSQLEDVYTSIPCIVVAVRDGLHGAEVDIQPAVNQRLVNGMVAQRPPILGVPVIFPCSKTAAFTFPINVGDTGCAVFSMRSLEAWKAGEGYPTAPLNSAQFDPQDAVFFPGLQPPGVSVNNPNKRVWLHDTKDAVLVNNIGTAEEVEVRLKASGDININTTKNVSVNCNTATIVADSSISISAPTTTWDGDIILNGNISQSGNYTATGTLSFNGIDFSSHVHGSSPGPSNP